MDAESCACQPRSAFKWFRASGVGAKRAWHCCELIGKRQMLVIGGTDPSFPSGTIPDPRKHGLGIFDMTDLSWSSSYNASSKPYEQPPVVKQFYAANSPQPSVWNDPALATIFATNTITTQPSSSSVGVNIVASGSSAAHRNHTGAIAGGVVGGLFVICILLGLFLFLLRRQRHKQRVDQTSPPPIVSELDKNTPAQEMPIDTVHRSILQLGPADPWELDATRKSVAQSSVAEVEG